MACKSKATPKVWIPNRLNLLLLLVLQLASLPFAFSVITQPFLNPDKLAYLSTLKSVSSDSVLVACTKSLIATLVIQWWFCSRLLAWSETAQVANDKLRNAFNKQIGKVEKVEEKKVGGLLKQMEAFSLTLFATPLLFAIAYGAVWLFGSTAKKVQNAVMATHVVLLALLPLVHVLGLPGLHGEGTIIDGKKGWADLVSLRTPPHLLPLLPPAIGALTAILLSTPALALDWEEGWQTFPFPQIVASFFGLAAGNLYVIAKLFQ